MEKTILSEQIKVIESTFDSRIIKLNSLSFNDLFFKGYLNKKYVGGHEILIKKFTRHITKLKNDSIKEVSEKYINIMSSADFNSDELIISVEWKKSSMWGLNPRANTNYGFEGSSIRGCGYDKLSEAVSQALNSHKPILKELYKLQNYNLNQKAVLTLKDLFDYGLSGTNNIVNPSFAGGVGVSCYNPILNKVGLEFKGLSHTKFNDVFIVRKLQK